MSDEPLNEHELRTVGMSRSGNHAILHWIVEQASGRVVFLNCAEPKTNPFATARPLGDGRRAVASFPGFDLEAEREGRLSPKDWVIYSYEDAFLGLVASDTFETRRRDFLGPSGRRLDALVLRDPFNLMASRRKAGFVRGDDRAPPGMVGEATALRIWKQHARQALGERRYLDDPVLVLFNAWATDRTYREATARSLGLDFDDAPARRVPDTAGGSSFQGTEADGQAGAMPVTRRWRRYADDPSYRSLFDAETLELSEALFGEIPGTRSLLDARA